MRMLDKSSPAVGAIFFHTDRFMRSLDYGFIRERRPPDVGVSGTALCIAARTPTVVTIIVSLGSAVTSTVTFASATGSLILSPSSIPLCTSIALLNVRKPLDLTVITYCPALTLDRVHSPAGPVTPAIISLLDLLARIISAWGITKPCWSTTVSLISESFCWLWLHSQVARGALLLPIATVTLINAVKTAAPRRDAFRRIARKLQGQSCVRTVPLARR